MNEPALRHLWRSFATIGRGDEAEKQLARLLMLPFIDLNFTQARATRSSCIRQPLMGIQREMRSHALTDQAVLVVSAGPAGRQLERVVLGPR